MDWGLAKVTGRPENAAGAAGRVTRSPVSTLDGTVLGTPSYMPPEQARGDLDAVGPHSDVYSVGAMLYTLLTGRMPYVRPNSKPASEAILAKVLAGPPNPVRRISPTVPEELIAICETAMARHPDDRYPSMVEMAEDLRAYLEGRVVQAYETGAVAEFRKWVQRNRMAAGAIFAAGMLTLCALVAVLVVQVRSRQRIETTNAELNLALEAGATAHAQALEAKGELEQANAELVAANEALRKARDAASQNEASALEAKALADATADLLGREATTNARLLDFVLGLFELPEGASARGETISAKEILDAGSRDLESVIQEDDGTRVRLLEVLGRTYLALGLVDDADAVLSRALVVGAEIDGFRAEPVLFELHRVADQRFDMGQRDRAKALYSTLVAAFEGIEGAGGVRTFECRARLGQILRAEGEYAEALEYLPDALEGLRRAKGDDDEATLAVMLDLALLHVESGTPWAAQELLEECVDRSRRVHGGRADETLEAIQHLAAFRLRNGRLMEAEALYREAFEAYFREARRDGPAHRQRPPGPGGRRGAPASDQGPRAPAAGPAHPLHRRPGARQPRHPARGRRPGGRADRPGQAGRGPRAGAHRPGANPRGGPGLRAPQGAPGVPGRRLAFGIPRGRTRLSPQALESLGQAPLHRRQVDAQERGDLGPMQALDVAQLDHLAVARRQIVDRIRQLGPALLRDQGAEGPALGASDLGGGGERGDPAPLAVPQAGNAPVAGRAVQEGGGVLELLLLGQGRHEHLLHHLLGLVGVPQIAAAEVGQGGSEALRQLPAVPSRGVDLLGSHGQTVYRGGAGGQPQKKAPDSTGRGLTPSDLLMGRPSRPLWGLGGRPCQQASYEWGRPSGRSPGRTRVVSWRTHPAVSFFAPRPRPPSARLPEPLRSPSPGDDSSHPGRSTPTGRGEPMPPAAPGPRPEPGRDLR